MAETDVADVIYPNADWGKIIGLALAGQYLQVSDENDPPDENSLSIVLRDGLFQIDVREK